MSFSFLHLSRLSSKPLKETRFVYEKMEVSNVKNRRVLREEMLNVEKLRVKLKSPPPYIKPLARAPIKKSFPYSTYIKKNILRKESKKSIQVKIAVDSLLKKISSSLYTNYYEAIRERIRMMAYKNFKFQENGEVSLSFIIQRNGRLLKVVIRREESEATPRLLAIAQKSIIDASPFPEFPEALDYPYLTFNLHISFQYKA